MKRAIGLTAAKARLSRRIGIPLSGGGLLVALAFMVLTIHVFTSSTEPIITTFAGGGFGGLGDGGQATASQVSPAGVAVDDAGNVYIADGASHRVRKVTVATGVITTVAGTGTGGFSGDGGAATAAQLNYPNGVAVDASGNLYIVDLSNQRIRKVTMATGVISTVAGSGVSTGISGLLGDNGPATAACLYDPSGVAVDGAGNVYIADKQNNRIRKVTIATGVITTFAGGGSGGLGDGGQATAARLFWPNGVAVDGTGNVYIADEGYQRIRKVTMATGVIITVAGTGEFGFVGNNGPATAAQLYFPFGVAVDGAGNVYIADTYNQRIRKVTLTTGVITTVGGTGTRDFSGDGGAATAATLNYPRGVAVDGAGNLYISDDNNARIRKIADAASAAITTQPTNQTIVAGDMATFTAAASGNPTPTVQWQLSTNNGLTFSIISGATATTYSFTAVVADNGKQFRAVFTNSVGSATSNAATLGVNVAPVVTTQPMSQTIGSGQTASLSVVASGSGLSYQWYVGTAGTTTSPIGGATSSSHTTPSLISSKSYWVRVSNSFGVADSTAATISVAFADDPLTAGVSMIRAVHVTELRARIDALRSRYSLGGYSYTNSTITAGVSAVQSKDITEMRQALQDVYVAAGRPLPSYTTSPIVGSAIVATAITELRAAVVAIE